jgi:release factor glutamine methyltransferase
MVHTLLESSDVQEVLVPSTCFSSQLHSVTLPFTPQLDSSTWRNYDPAAATMRIIDVLAQAANWLHTVGLANARYDAEVLLAHLLGTTRPVLLQIAAASLSAEHLEALRMLLIRRARHEPLQYILGEAEFCGLPFLVKPGVFIPRPETELLARRALAVCSREGGVALDLCTGSGAVGCTVAIHHPRLHILAIDLSPVAADCARQNVRRFNLEHRVSVLQGDLYEPLVISRVAVALRGRCQLVLANPPYVPRAALSSLPQEMGRWDPRPALDGGPAGTSTIERILDGAPEWLRPGGTVLVELGFDQIPRILERLEKDGRYEAAIIHRDSCGYDRMLEIRRAWSNPRRRRYALGTP